MPRASIADRRQSPPLTDSAPSVEGTGVYRQYLPSRADSSDFGLLGEQSSPDSLPWAPMNRRAKFDAGNFIVAREIRNRTNTQNTNSNLSACVDNNINLLTG